MNYDDLAIKHTMTEHKLWLKISPWFNSRGVAYRIENVANTSPPDVTFVHEEGIYLIELKILHGNKVNFEIGQIPLFHQIDVESDGKYPLIFGWDQRLDGIRVVPFYEFDLMKGMTKNHALTFPMGCATEAVVHNSQEFEKWLHLRR